MKIILPFIFIVLAIGIFFGYTNSHYQQLQAQRVVLDHIQEAQRNAAELAKKMDSLKAARNSIPTEDVDRLNLMLPDSVENVGLIIEINNFALKNGLGYVKNPQMNQGASGRTVAKGPDSQKYGSLAMTFNISGSYDQIQKFLQDLETYIRLVDVIGLSFTSNSQGRYDYSVTIQTYWLK